MQQDQTGRVWIDTALFTRNGDGAISPILGAGVLATPHLEFEAALPMGIATGNDGGSIVGNPYVGLSYVRNGPDFRLMAGGGLALPVINIKSSGDVNAATAGLAPRALQESWFWYDEAVPIVAPFHIEAPLGSPVSFVGDAAMLLVIPTAGRNQADLAFQLAPGIAGHASDVVSIGARLPIFWLAVSEGNGDRTQVAFEPFVRIASNPVFASIRFTMPLDAPLGFAFDHNKVWGLHLGAGLAF